MIPRRRQSDKGSRRQLAVASRVPNCVEVFYGTLQSQAIYMAPDEDPEELVQRIQNVSFVEHVPNMELFQLAFFSRRAARVELHMDAETERLYLIGIGLPNREEMQVQLYQVRDKHGDVVGYEPNTQLSIQQDLVVTYIEISWDQIRLAETRVEELDPFVKEDIAKYFRIPVKHLPAVFAVLESFTLEQILGMVYNEF